MPALSMVLIKKLRKAVLEGKDIPALVDIMYDHELGDEKDAEGGIINLPDPDDPKSCLIPIMYLYRAFYLGLNQSKALGEWNRYATPGRSIEEINRELMPLILANQKEWDV